jgi:hypothetical protein
MEGVPYRYYRQRTPCRSIEIARRPGHTLRERPRVAFPEFGTRHLQSRPLPLACCNVHQRPSETESRIRRASTAGPELPNYATSVNNWYCVAIPHGFFQNTLERRIILCLLGARYPRIGAVDNAINQSAIGRSFRSSHTKSLTNQAYLVKIGS